MKKRGIHTIAWVILGAALLFNQVGLNFFHDRHDAHEYFTATQKNQTMLLHHGEHCQVCSLEVLFNVVLPVSTEIPAQEFTSEYSEGASREPVFIFFGLSRGRAPPSVV